MISKPASLSKEQTSWLKQARVWRFPFDKLVKFYGLDQINQAAEDSEKRGTIKPVIRMH